MVYAERSELGSFEKKLKKQSCQVIGFFSLSFSSLVPHLRWGVVASGIEHLGCSIVLLTSKG